MASDSLPRLDCTFTASADVASATVQVRGELELQTVELLRGTVDVLLTAGRRRITMNLHQLTAIDRAGVLFFTALQHDLSTHRGDLCLVNATTPVRAALRHGQVRYTEIAQVALG